MYMAVGFNSQEVILKYDQASENPVNPKEHKPTTPSSAQNN